LFEHNMQAAVIQWANLQAPSRLALATLFAVPNGARTSEGVAKKLKAEGMKAGVSDLILPVPAGGYPGLQVEMKTQDGAVSGPQKRWREAMIALGFRHEVCRTIESACDVLLEHASAWEAEATPQARAALLALWRGEFAEKAQRAERALKRKTPSVAAGRSGRVSS
jgi:hypothetical protein